MGGSPSSGSLPSHPYRGHHLSAVLRKHAFAHPGIQAAPSGTSRADLVFHSHLGSRPNSLTVALAQVPPCSQASLSHM